MIGNIVGNYKITEKIGEGGMGAVFKGVDLMLEREVAIKALRAELGRQPQLVERFRSEAVTLAKLNHPNIATLYSFFRQGDDFFMVMEFVRGETLENVIRQQGAVPVDRALPLFCQALEGIGSAHKMGIVHRDVKPANVMLTYDGSIKVMDFGIARVLGTNRMTKQGTVVGTIEYMSPEQVRGEETDARSDIYSLGILLYEMLTGRVPFRSDSEYELMRAQIEDPPPPPSQFVRIPQNVEEAIMRALAKTPEARFQTAGALRSALLGAPAAQKATQPNMPKETRVGTESVSSPGGFAARETRMAPGGGVTQSSEETMLLPAARASLFSRLNWKHYAAASVVLLVLLISPFVIAALMGGDREGTPSTQSVQPTPAAIQTGPAANPPPPPQLNPSLPLAPAAVNPLEAGVPTNSNASGEVGGERTAKSKTKSADMAARERARRRAAAEKALDR